MKEDEIMTDYRVERQLGNGRWIALYITEKQREAIREAKRYAVEDPSASLRVVSYLSKYDAECLNKPQPDKIYWNTKTRQRA